jgi:hypothetical protein
MLTAVAIIGLIVLGTVGSVFAIGVIDARIQQVIATRQNSTHPNVRLSCIMGIAARLYLADHHCVTQCPSGFQPISYDQGLAPICMSSTNEPVSIYDLTGMYVSADNGSTIYLVIADVPMARVLITGTANLNINLWLQVSQSVLDQIVNLGPYSAWTFPRTTTEVATIRDVAGIFQILQIHPTSADGLLRIPYPLCCWIQNKTITVGDDVGVSCAGLSERLVSIDFSDQILIFSRVQSVQTFSCPICLSGSTLIDTPHGQANVKELAVGMLVWTMNVQGQRVSMPIAELGKTQVTVVHHMVHVVLQDGRQLYVSPGHPTIDGRHFGQLKNGDSLDGSRVVLAELVPYDQSYTYDLLPAGDTGYYWANGILVASTLE